MGGPLAPRVAHRLNSLRELATLGLVRRTKGRLGTHAMSTFPVEQVRRQFPALQRVVDGRTPVYLDGPGGTQVPQRVIDAMVHYLSTCNANHGGVFTTSRE